MAMKSQTAEDLMSVLGHELRSPLTAIRGASSLLLMAHSDLPPEKVVELLRVIDSQAGRMADRVDDVLVAGRLAAGELSLMEEEVELADVIADVLEDARGQATDRRIRAPGVVEGVTVMGDQQRVTQVLRVLVENAIRFSPPGSPVEVRVAAQRGMARIEVRDRGQGIAAEYRERVFERGIRLDESGPGAGLGLYVASGLAAAMGGSAGAEPRAGGGATVWFTLPTATK
jgi:signal transduction histidine kinase